MDSPSLRHRFNDCSGGDSLQKQSKHVRLHVLPSPVLEREVSSSLGYPSRKLIVATLSPVGRADEERQDGVKVGVVDLARLGRVNGWRCKVIARQDSNRQ
jgi:hypothetical protein